MSNFTTDQLKTMIAVMVKKYGIGGVVVLDHNDYDEMDQRILLHFLLNDQNDLMIELLSEDALKPTKPHLHVVH